MATNWMTPELVAMWAEQQGITPEQAKQKAIEGLQNITAQAQQKQKEWDQQQAAQQQQQQAPAQTQQAPVQTQQNTGALANVSDDAQQDTGKTVYMTSNTGKAVPNYRKSNSLIYMVDQDTGKMYVYDDHEGKTESTGWQNNVAPPTNSNLKISSIATKEDGDWKSQDLSDQNLTWGGITDPETQAQYDAQVQKDDKSDNDIYYEHNGKTYVDVSGTGQGIPVGSTNITKDPIFINDDGTLKVDTSGNTAVLAKGFTSYFDQNTEFDKFEEDKKPPYGKEDLTFGNVFSLTPGGTVIDTGFKNPFGEGNIEFSNPPSQLQNLEPFFNQAESIGYKKYKEQMQPTDPSWLEKQFGVTPVSKTIGEIIQDTGGSSTFPDGGSGGSGGGGEDDDDDNGGGGGGDDDDSTTPPKFAFAPPMKSDPISTAPDEPINTDPRFQPIFPQQPTQPVEGLYPIPTNPIYGGPASPQASPAMPQPQPIPIEAQPAVMPPSFMNPAQSVPAVIPPPTFADVMAQGGTQGQAGINPYFQAIEQLNASSPYSPIMGMAGGGGIMSLQNRMLMDPASRAMSQGIMS